MKKMLSTVHVGHRAAALLAAAILSVGGLVVAPAHARANGNIATGTILLDWNYGATPLAANLATCGPASPTMTTLAGAAVGESIPFTEYPGPIALTTTAPIVSGSCNFTTAEGGTLSAVTFSGTILGAFLTCNNMSGTYTRTGPNFGMTLSTSSCNFNSKVTIGAVLSISGVWAPTMPTSAGGVSDSTVAGTFLLTS